MDEPESGDPNILYSVYCRYDQVLGRKIQDCFGYFFSFVTCFLFPNLMHYIGSHDEIE